MYVYICVCIYRPSFDVPWSGWFNFILQYICPHTTIYVSSGLSFTRDGVGRLVQLHTPIYVSSYYCICVLILLYMYPHTTIHVSSYYYICVLIQLYMCLYVSICVLRPEFHARWRGPFSRG